MFCYSWSSIVLIIARVGTRFLHDWHSCSEEFFSAQVIWPVIDTAARDILHCCMVKSYFYYGKCEGQEIIMGLSLSLKFAFESG